MDEWMDKYMTYSLFLFDYFYLLNRPAPDLSVTDLLHNALDIALLNYAQGK
jgi:hypothetical protein